MKTDKKLLGKTRGIFDTVLDAGAVGSATLIVFIMLAICAEVVLRRLGHPQIWEIEVTEYCLLYATFLGTAWLLRDEGHVKVDIITSAINCKARALLGVVTSVIGSAISLYLVVWGWKVTLTYFQRGVVECTPLLTPTYIVLLIIPLGSIPLFVQFLRRTHGYLKTLKSSANGERKQS